MQNKPFSEDLAIWLRSKKPKTIDSLSKTFQEKTFALLFMLLLFPSSLPLPTGGVTNIFELIAMLLALELIIGRTTISLPGRIRRISLNRLAKKKNAEFIIRRVKQIEKYARPRAGAFLNSRYFKPFYGLTVLLFTLGAFVAPPFAGIDTLPSLGVVVISLGVIFEDSPLYGLGFLIGAAGIGIEIGISSTIVAFFQDLFSVIAV